MEGWLNFFASSSVMLSLYGSRRTVVSNNQDSVEPPPSRSGVSLETMEKFDSVVSYIDKNFTDSKINLPSLSAFSGLGKTFLSTLFPKLTGRSFTEYTCKWKKSAENKNFS